MTNPYRQNISPSVDEPRGQRAFGRGLSRDSVYIFIAALAFYAVTISNNLGITHDSSVYLNWFDHGIYLFMPHHLLYHIAALGWLRGIQWSGIASDPAFIVALLNSIAGAACLSLCYRILRVRSDQSRNWSLIIVSLIAFSYGFWFYSICVEVYLIPLFFLLLTFFFLTSAEFDSKTLWRVALCHAAAVLFHQSNVIFYVPVCFALLLHHKTGKISFWKSWARYTLGVTLLTVIPYILVMRYYVQATSVKDAWSWLTLYSHELAGTWQGVSAGTFGKVAIGFGRAFIGGHFLFALTPLRDRLDQILKGHWLNDEAFLVRAMPNWEALLLCFLALLVLASVVFVLLRKRQSTAKTNVLPNENKLFTRVALAWIISYAIFFYFWDPTNNEFWIPQSVALWLLIGNLGQRKNTKTNRRALIVAAGSLLFVNFFGTIIFAQSKNDDYYYREIDGILEESGPDDLIVLSDDWLERSYVDYYGKSTFVSLGRLKAEDTLGWMNQLSDSITVFRERGGRVFILQDAVHPSATIIDTYGLDTLQLRELWRPYASQWQSLKLGLDTVRILSPK